MPLRVFSVCSDLYPIGLNRDHLSDARLDLDNFGLIFGYSGSNMANFTSQEILNTLKILYNHAHMSVLGVCSQSRDG